jgi:hypothetical protein
MWKLDKIRTISFLLELVGATGMFAKIKTAISGWKTYIVAGVAIVTAVVTWSQDGISTIQLVEAVFAAITAMTIKAAIVKSGPTK